MSCYGLEIGLLDNPKQPGHATQRKGRAVSLLSVTLLLAVGLCGCGPSPGQHNVTWEHEGNDVRVIETFVDREGDRRNFFVAATLGGIDVSGHVVTVRNNKETFKVYCFDEEQAGELFRVLEAARDAPR